MQKEIEIKNITKRYGRNIPVLENVSFNIRKGEFVFVVGNSGSGKSTLLKLISGQLFTEEGEVIVDGANVSELTADQMPYFRRKFGIIQKGNELLNYKNIYNNIKLAMVATEQPRDIIDLRISKTLKTVGIYDKAHCFPNELSAGEYARALLARAISVSPRIMILDEPTANLSSGASWDIMHLLEELNRLGITIIVASHDRELVTVMQKRVLTLVSGVLVSDVRRGIYDGKLMDKFEEQRVANERKNKKS